MTPSFWLTLATIICVTLMVCGVDLAKVFMSGRKCKSCNKSCKKREANTQATDGAKE